ncbi:MAG: PQQ-like beta-propeller repeat protein [Planctomycetales bacterium]|nr:PQQ-like beta-propeller repeat protein [Planctomycetales bacterium]
MHASYQPLKSVRFNRRSTERTPLRCLAVLLGLGLGMTYGANLAHADEPAWDRFQSGGSTLVEGELPMQWRPEGESIVWTADIEGYGQSSPILHGERVYVTSTSGENKERFHVTALALASGEPIWRASFDNPTPETNNNYVCRAAPSPAVDATALYVMNEGGVLASLDFDGGLRWERDLVDEFGPISARHGLAASLEQNEEHLFVWIERESDPYLLCINKGSGETVWKVDGLGATTWGSPRLVQVAGGEQLVCSASGILVGFDPVTGERLWTLQDIANNTSSTPMPAGDGRFFIGVSNGRGEDQAGGGDTASGMVSIERQEGGQYQARFIWRADRARCSFGSPLVAGGQVWVVNQTGVLFRLDAETGETRSTTRLAAGGIWATPLANDKQVYFFGQKGVTSIVAIDSGEEVASNELWAGGDDQPAGAPGFSGHIQYAAAAGDGVLVIRRGDRVYAIR